MQRGEKVHEGKAKVVFRTADPELFIQYFKDDATAFDGKKRGTVTGKGAINARISAALFQLLEGAGIRTHFVDQLDDTQMLVKAVEIVPIEVVVRNIIAGSLSRRTGLDEGTALAHPIVELYYKRDDLGDPLFNRDHIRVLGLASEAIVDQMVASSRRVNELLSEFFAGVGITLVDYKLEYGLAGDELLLADEISPDTCRFWDAQTGEKLDKDRFRRDMGRVEEAYQEVLGRIRASGSTPAR
jgi:phosphoribosylaminoimidazole-succinocarboxamide synthase